MNYLKNIRLEYKLTLKQMADLLGVLPTSLSYYEIGKPTPDDDKINRIVAMLKTPIKSELTDEERLKLLKNNSIYSNEMFSPFQKIACGKNYLSLERVITNNQVDYLLILSRNNKIVLDMKLSKGDFYSLKDCLFEILESELLFSVEKKDCSVFRSSADKGEGCAVCTEKNNLLLINVSNNRIVLCEKCAEKLYYKSDDLIFNYLEGKLF